MPLYQRHVELYRQRLRDERKPHAAAIYDSENQGDPTAAVCAASEWSGWVPDDEQVAVGATGEAFTLSSACRQIGCGASSLRAVRAVWLVLGVLKLCAN